MFVPKGRCSIRLSYRRIQNFTQVSFIKVKWSGQRDSNPRPSAPKADALPGCAMPRLFNSPASTGRGMIRSPLYRVNSQT